MTTWSSEFGDESVAVRASVPVTSVYNGFDWEKGQVRIESSEQIYSLSYLKAMIPDIEEQLDSARRSRRQALPARFRS